MKIAEVRAIAKSMGIRAAATASKADLVREIQKSEGNFACFGSAKEYCDQLDCRWRDDCRTASKAGGAR